MNLGQLIAQFRRETDDVRAPYLWSRDEAIDYANEAQEQACRRSRLIVDSDTDEICRHSIAANSSGVLTLDKRVIFVRRAKLDSKTLPLGKASVAMMDAEIAGWQDHTGDVVAWIPDLTTGKIRLYRKPTAADTLRLTVVRLPLVDMADEKDEPEIGQAYHRRLTAWMRYRAYSKRDAETFDEKASLKALAEFVAEFGEESSAQNETWNHEHHGYDTYEGLY